METRQTADVGAQSARTMDNDGNDGDEDGVGVCGDDGNDAVDDDGAAAADPAAHEHNDRVFRRLINYQPKEPMSCELCGDTFGMPVSYHMLTAHPGCGQSSGGRGYTSNGTYKTGWSGACGEGGIAWYLLCESCRGGYMNRVKSATPGPVRVRKTAAVLRRNDANRDRAGKLG